MMRSYSERLRVAEEVPPNFPTKFYSMRNSCKHPDLSRGVLSWRSDDEDPDLGKRIAVHQSYQTGRRKLFLRQEIRQGGYADPRDGCRSKSRPVVRFESTLRMYGDRFVKCAMSFSRGCVVSKK
jgi:hypothetical protein